MRMSLPLIGLILIVAVTGCSRPDAAGTWEGVLEAGPARFRVVFNITRDADGLTATLESPDQGIKGIPVEKTEFANGRLRLDIRAIAASFEGVIDQDRLTGNWRQAGQEFPLELTRADLPAPTGRPQDPVPPFPYLSEDVNFPGPVGDIAGTLTLPEGRGPFPAVLLISGSGQRDRDQQMFGHRPFLVLSDYMTRLDFAVLRCDDRGVGGSTGDPTLATTEDFARDARAALDWLRARPETDPNRTGVIGHSEGGLIGTMLAAREDGPDFLVLLAGSGIPGYELLPIQGELLMRAGGASEAAIAMNRQLQERLFEIARRFDQPEQRGEELRRGLETAIEKMAPEVRAELTAELSPEAVAAQVRMIASPWFRFFLDYDPAPDLRRVRVPVLVLGGSRDLQVPPDRNFPAIEAALKAGDNPDHTIRELPGLNHLFQTAETGSLLEYGRIAETFAPVALEAIGSWLGERSLPTAQAQRKPTED